MGKYKHYVELAIGVFGVLLSVAEGIATSITDATLGGVEFVLPSFMARGVYNMLAWLVDISPYFRFGFSLLLFAASIGIVIWAIRGIIVDRRANKSDVMITVKEFRTELEGLISALDRTTQTIKAVAEQLASKEGNDADKK